MQKTPMYRSSRTALALMAVAASMPATVTVATAGEGGNYSGLAQPEMIRRQEAVIDADRLLLEADLDLGEVVGSLIYNDLAHDLSLRLRLI